MSTDLQHSVESAQNGNVGDAVGEHCRGHNLRGKTGGGGDTVTRLSDN